MAVREWGEEIIFVYRILPGSTDRSYGIHVARIAGLPADTIQRADELLRSLEVQTESTASATAPKKPAPAQPGEQLGLFTEYLDHPVVQSLREIDLKSLTPLEAFDRLRQLIDEAGPSLEEGS